MPAEEGKFEARFFIQKDVKEEIVRGYDMLVETPQRPFSPEHFTMYLMTASPENFFIS